MTLSLLIYIFSTSPNAFYSSESWTSYDLAEFVLYRRFDESEFEIGDGIILSLISWWLDSEYLLMRDFGSEWVGSLIKLRYFNWVLEEEDEYSL